MEFTPVQNDQWSEIKKIYMEAFPKCERKPYFALRYSVQTGKTHMMVASENHQVCGFIALISYKSAIIVDYLAVSSKIRSKGTGSYMLKKIQQQFSDKNIILLIERPDDFAKNREQRIARRKFYLKNGFTSSNLFITGVSGDMEIMNCGNVLSKDECIPLLKYAIGNLFFRLSHIKLIENNL